MQAGKDQYNQCFILSNLSATGVVHFPVYLKMIISKSWAVQGHLFLSFKDSISAPVVKDFIKNADLNLVLFLLPLILLGYR